MMKYMDEEFADINQIKAKYEDLSSRPKFSLDVSNLNACVKNVNNEDLLEINCQSKMVVFTIKFFNTYD